MQKKTKNTKMIPKDKAKLADLIRRVYKNSVLMLVGEAVLFSVLGVLMMFEPVEFLTSVTRVVGVGLVFFGLYRVGMAFVSSHGMSIWTFDVFLGLLGLVLGMVFCIFPYSATTSVVYIFIVLFLMNALRVVFFAINMLRIHFGHYWIDLCLGLGLVIVAFTLLLMPNLGTGILMWFLAGYLLLYAASDIYMFIKLSKIKRAIAE
ncbi:MAG: DUF308 domain-containing protein [Alphaproteobacteria bacterium]|nr:DUF308 domain-containing protein [Alphaproteobacteria bacterium]